MVAEPNTLYWTDATDPGPRPSEVAFRARFTGLCGTDLHIFDGTHPPVRFPLVLGHEIVGVVEGACLVGLGASGSSADLIPGHLTTGELGRESDGAIRFAQCVRDIRHGQLRTVDTDGLFMIDAARTPVDGIRLATPA